MMSALPSYGSLRACNGTKSQPLPSSASAASPTKPKPVEARRKSHGIEAALVGNLGGKHRETASAPVLPHDLEKWFMSDGFDLEPVMRGAA